MEVAVWLVAAAWISPLYPCAPLGGQGPQAGGSSSAQERTADVPPGIRTALEAIDSAIAAEDIELARGALHEIVAGLPELAFASDEVRLEALLALDARLQRVESVEDSVRVSEELLAVRARLLPPEHPELLRAMSNLAVARMQLGDLAGARELLEQVLSVQERKLPEEHPDLQVTRSNLATVLYELGDLAGARGMNQKVLDTYSRVLPGDHPNLVSARSNLANILKAAGELERARTLEEEVLEVRRRTLPPGHPDLLLAMQNLAGTRRELGDTAGARGLFQDVLAVGTHVLGPDHPMVVATKRNLDQLNAAPQTNSGFSLSQFGLHFESEDFGQTLQQMDVETLPPEFLAPLELLLESRLSELAADHPDFVSCMEDLADVRKALGDPDGTREILEDLLASLASTVPQSHPHLQRARRKLAEHCLGTAEFRKAIELLETVVQVGAETLPPDHPDQQEVRRDLAAALRVAGELERARRVEAEIRAASAYPPALHLISPRGPYATVAERRFSLVASALDYTGIKALRVLQDGLELDLGAQPGAFEIDESGSKARLQLAVEIPGDRAETTLMLQAVGANGAKSERETVIVRHQPPLQELYLLLVGVGNYADDAIDLEFPANDVCELVAFFETQTGSFYRAVHVRQLIDAEVAAERITELKHQFLLRARPEDTLLVFLAGHGVRTEADEYFFLTPKATPDAPWSGLERAQVESLVTWERLRARRRVLLLDTCHAGMRVEESLRGTERGVGVYSPAEADALASSPRRGVYVLAASTDYGFAREQAGNGLFTRTLLDGLLGAADTDEDGLVQIEELRSFTEREVERKSAGRQVPTMPIVMGGENFPLARVARVE